MHKMFLLSALLLSASAWAASPVALVYVQPTANYAPEGFAPIYVYTASSSGKLTQIEESPLNISGLIVGSNGKDLITLVPEPDYGYAEINDYAVKSNGVTGNLLGDTSIGCPYDGIPQGELDRSGKYVWVGCDTNLMKFSASTLATESIPVYLRVPTDYGSWYTLPTFASSKAIPIGVFYDPEGYSCNSFFYSWAIYGGPLPPSGESFIPTGPMTNDPSDHLAVAMVSVDAPLFSCGAEGPAQLASYLVNNSGEDVGLFSTNTWENMPTVWQGVSSMVLNPAGTVLAVATGTGIQFFHFNGAKPITEFTGIIGTSGYVSTMAWDKDNHLYAINGASGRLHVYEATTKLVKEVSGSPYNNVCGENTCTLVVRAE
jgi:hypothetical protein